MSQTRIEADSLNTSRFTQDDFGSAFRQNLRAAESTVVIVSPFIRLKRLNFWLPEFVAAIKRGLKICVFLQKPKDSDDEANIVFELNQQPIEEFNALVQKLQSKDVHVILRPNIHQKIAIIDRQTVWEGSLNILSYTGMTHEQMLRMDCTESAEWMMARHSLNCPQCKRKPVSHLEWFGKQFANCRDALGVNQHQLASLIDITQSTVSKIENGAWNMEADTLIQFSERMNFQIGFVTQRLATNAKIHQINVPKDPLNPRQTIGWQLAYHRNLQGLTQEALVEGLEISRTELARIEKGRRNTTIERLSVLGEALGLALVLVPNAP